MFIRFRTFNFFIFKTKFIYYFYNFNSFFYKNLPVLNKIELLLPFKKKYKKIYSVLSFLSFRLICFQKPCYKIISGVEFWKKGKRFYKNKIRYKYMFVTLRGFSAYSFLDLLINNVYKYNIVKYFLFFKKNLEYFCAVSNSFFLEEFSGFQSKYLPFNLTTSNCFLRQLKVNYLQKTPIFSFLLFFNILDFPLCFNYFSLVNKLLNLKVYVNVKSVLKEHSIFFIKFLNLIL